MRERGRVASSSECGDLRPECGRGRVWSVAAAAAVTGCLLWTARAGPLPALPLTAAFLFLAVEQDVRRRRIPNWLTAPALLAAVAIAAGAGAWSGALTALAGAAVALAVLLVPFAFGGLGAGDVKAAMVFGALWGVQDLLPALWWMVVAGGVMALAVVVAHGELGALLARWARRLARTLRRARRDLAPAGAVARGGLPFAPAMGLGASAYQLWGWPWL